MAEVQAIERHIHSTLLPDGAVLSVDDQDLEAQLGEQVERGVSVGDVDLRLLAHLHAGDEVGLALGGQNPPRPAVEHAQAQRGAPCRLARPDEPEVLLVIRALEAVAELPERGPQARVVRRAG